MAHRLLTNVFWAGIEYGPGLPAGDQIPGLSLSDEAGLVSSNRAVYTSPPPVINNGLPVLWVPNPDGGNRITAGNVEIDLEFGLSLSTSEADAAANTTKLQTALNASNDVRVRGSLGDVWINDTLLVRSNTHFEVGHGSRLKMLGGVGKSLVRNAATAQNPTAVTISYTAGRIATINWTAHARKVGDAVVIQGVTNEVAWNNVYRISKVPSVDAVEITLTDLPAAAPAGSPVVYVCDRNIRANLNVDYNVAQNAGVAQSPHRMATVWNFIADSEIVVHGINTLKYISQIGGAHNVDFKCTGESGSDMHKIYGPARNVRSVVQGSSHDDCATFQCKEPAQFSNYQLSVGPIDGCTLRDCSMTQASGTSSGTVVVYADDVYRHDNILIEGPGSIMSNERIALAIKTGSTFTSSAGRIGRVTVRYVQLGSKAGEYVLSLSTDIEHLVIDSVEMLQSDLATQWFRQEATSSARIIEFRNLNLQAELLAATTILFNLNGAVDLCIFRNCRVVARPSPNNKARLINIGTNGVKKVVIDGGYYEYLDTIATIAASNSTVTELEIGGGAVFKNCASGITGLSNFTARLGSATFDTFVNGVVRPQNAGVVANVHGTGQTVFVSATPIMCISGGAAIPRGDLPVDIGATGITKAAGASCFNIGSGRGTIPQNRAVVCDGTNWLNATNLSHTF